MNGEQIEIKLDWLNDWIITLAIFVKYLYEVQNNEKETKNIKSRQNIKPK